MSEQPDNKSLVPNDWPSPKEVQEPKPHPDDVVPDDGCKPLAPNQPVRPNIKRFIPPTPTPKIV